MGKLFVGNVAWKATEEELKSHFETVGAVKSCKIPVDRETGRPRGFAFIDMENAEQAIQQLNGVEFAGRPLRIDVATDRPDRKR